MPNQNKNYVKKVDQVNETEVKDQVVETEAEATEVVKPEETTVEDAPVEKGFKGWFAGQKVKHPRLCKGVKKVCIVLGIVAAGMVGEKVGEKIQEKKDADLLQGAIDNGDLIRANNEMLEEANEMLESTDI